jgi:hypothetical protein
MKKINSIILLLLLNPIIFIGAQTLTGKWISHPFPATQFTPPLIRCGGTVSVFSHYQSGTISFFDANTGVWRDKKLNVGEYVLESSANGNIAFTYTNDSMLIAYSSIVHHLDTIKFQGRHLVDSQLWSCGTNLAVFATIEFLYVFDGYDGLWHVLNITLPSNYVFPASRILMGSDYALLLIYRGGGEPPKHYVYSLPHHAFNQIEYGPLLNEMMGHGYAGSITISENAKKLIGYSAISNQYSEIEAPFGLASQEEMGPHHLGGSIYAYLYTVVINPNYHWKTYFYVYSTLSGQWYVDVFDHLPTIGYAGLHVGAEYAQILRTEEIDLNLFSANPLVWSSYNNLFYQFYPDFRSVSGTMYPPGGYILGKNVLSIIHANTAWGYNAVTNLDDTCQVAGSISSSISNIYEGKDYIAFGKYESNNDSMNIYIFDGNNWLNLICGNYGGGAYYSVGTDELYGIYSFYQRSYKIEIIVYSKSLGYSIRYPLPYQTNFLGASAKGCILEMNTSNGHFVFDSQTLIPHQFSFQIYSDWISDSIAVLYDNTTHQIFGYSTNTKTWATFNTTSNINYNKIGTNVGLLMAGNNREKAFAYNGIYGNWVPLVPESKSFAYDGGDNFVVVFRDGIVYAFYTERNGPAIANTVLNNSAVAGSQIIEVADASYFSVGDSIIINPGGLTEEINKIISFGSIHLENPLQFNHNIGEQVMKFITTSVNDNGTAVPLTFELYQNYPNPFNPSTTISWQSPISGHQTIKLFDVLGREVETIVDGYYDAGSHSKLYIVNSTLSSGVYFYQLKAGDFVQTKKMIYLK